MVSRWPLSAAAGGNKNENVGTLSAWRKHETLPSIKCLSRRAHYEPPLTVTKIVQAEDNTKIILAFFVNENCANSANCHELY